MSAQFFFTMHAGPTPGKTFDLEGTSATIGREANNEVVINDPEISRKHSKLSFQGGTWVIEDLGSTNGTFVNETRLSGPHPLRLGDVIGLGEKIKLIYETSTADMNATMVAAPPTAAAPIPSQPVPANPVYYSTPPTPPPPSYAGQVPANPPPNMEAQPPAKNNNRTILIVVLSIILLCICACILFLTFAPTSFWCALPIDWGAGACP